MKIVIIKKNNPYPNQCGSCAYHTAHNVEYKNSGENIVQILINERMQVKEKIGGLFFDLINGDCLEKMKSIKSNSVDAIITDPPYTSPTVHAFGRQVVNRLSDLAIQEFYFSAIKTEWERILKPNAPILVFCDDIYSAVLMGLFYEWKQKSLVIWDKGRIGMGNPFRKQHELIFYANRDSLKLNKEKLTHIPTIIKAPLKKEFHGAEKPTELIETLLNGLTTKGANVLDPFMGSGTTGVACKNTNRNFIGIELDKNYFKIAQERINSTEPNPNGFEKTEAGGLFSFTDEPTKAD